MVMNRLIVFDLDGTLVDSRRDLAESANELLESYGARPLTEDRVTAMVGEGARILVERVLAAAAVERPVLEALDGFLSIYDRRLTNHTREYPGVRDALEGVGARAQLAVLTNKPGHHATRLLQALDLSRYFTSVIGGDSAFPRKPDPTALVHLITRAGATRASTLMVGDSMVDVETARRASTALCVARYGFGYVGADADCPPRTFFAASSADLAPVLTAFVGSAGSPA
jgi:phosphoglycolate phosphatase